MRRGRRSNKDLIVSWRLDHPKARKSDCKRELGLSYPTIKLYWDECGLGATMTARQIVETWCHNNPKGRMSFCMSDTGLCFRTVKRYWINDPIPLKKDETKKAAKKENAGEPAAKVTDENKGGQLDLFSFLD